MFPFVIFTKSMWQNIFYSFTLLGKSITFNISIDSSSLNIVLLLLPHLSQMLERTNSSIKMYEILGFLNFSFAYY